jgi:hypothetical protein
LINYSIKRIPEAVYTLLPGYGYGLVPDCGDPDGIPIPLF